VTKAQALYSFWASFGWTVVDEQSMYDEQTMADLGDPSRYISYESAVGELGDPIALDADLWHKSTSWATVEEKAEEIYDYIGYGGKFVHYDGGAIWITRRNPPYQRMEAAENVRRIHFYINAEFLSV
jgi:hypothetical protein